MRPDNPRTDNNRRSTVCVLIINYYYRTHSKNHFQKALYTYPLFVYIFIIFEKKMVYSKLKLYSYTV